jgi:hypothetical protein
MGILDSILGGGSSHSAPDIYGPVKAEVTPYYQPYVDAGTNSLGGLQEQLARMYQDPSALYDQLGAGYRESPGYQHNVQSATQAANRAAAAGGQLGSPAEQQALAGQISGMADQDYGNYMQNMMGMYGQGVQGLQGLTGMGYQASSGLADQLANARYQQAGLEAQARQADQAGMSGLLGALGMGAGMYFGGPMGGMLGGQLGGSAGNFFGA